MNKVVFFHNPQVAAIIPGVPVNYWKNAKLFKLFPKLSTDEVLSKFNLNY